MPEEEARRPTRAEQKEAIRADRIAAEELAARAAAEEAIWTPGTIVITVLRDEEAWDVVLVDDLKFVSRARATTIIRGVTMVLYDAGLLCEGHRESGMKLCAAHTAGRRGLRARLDDWFGRTLWRRGISRQVPQ